MDLIFGVLTLSFGVYALIKGRLQLSKKYVLEGNSATIAGVLLVVAPIIGAILTLNGQADSAIFGCSCYSIIGVLAFATFQAWKSKKPPLTQMKSQESEPEPTRKTVTQKKTPKIKKGQPVQKVVGITVCPNCKMKVLPTSDGTCPSCQSKIM